MSSFKMMFKRPDSMQSLFDDDPFRLLEDVGEKKVNMTFSDKVKSEFESVAAFIKEHQRLPDVHAEDFDEEELALSYLSLIQSNPEGQDYCESLLPEELRSDKVERLQRTTLTRDEVIKKQVEDMRSQLFESIDDILDADPFGLLGEDAGNDELSVHEYWRDSQDYRGNIREQSEPNAQAKACAEFAKFKPYFDEVKHLLHEGHIKSIKAVGINKIDIKPGQFFIIDGVLSLIVSANLSNKTYTKAADKVRYRVRQIFDNGSEILPFNTSVKASFYKSKTPCVRLDAADSQGKEFFQRLEQVLDYDFGPLLEDAEKKGKSKGFVYILGTLSKDPVILDLLQKGSLIKIGYTDKTVEERIAGAQKSSTYLFAPVKILYKIECFDFDANKLEEALHTVFASQRLNVTLKDHQGATYHPEEWFTVSAETAIKVVEHIMANDLHLFYIDPIQGKLKLRQKLEI